MSPLASRSCVPLANQPPMDRTAIETHLALVDGWHFHDGAIERTFTFADYHRTMAFANAVAWVAHSQDHHPQMLVEYNRCTVRFDTHSVGGVSINDFICAARLDALGPG